MGDQYWISAYAGAGKAPGLTGMGLARPERECEWGNGQRAKGKQEEKRIVKKAFGGEKTFICTTGIEGS